MIRPYQGRYLAYQIGAQLGAPNKFMVLYPALSPVFDITLSLIRSEFASQRQCIQPYHEIEDSARFLQRLSTTDEPEFRRIMATLANRTANSWLTTQLAIETVNTTIFWPWKHLTLADLAYIQGSTPWVPWVTPGNIILLYPLFPLGCIGNIFIVLTIAGGKRGQRKEKFDYCMLAVAVLDLAYLLMKFSYAYLKSDPGFATKHPILNFYLFFVAGIMFACSLMADLITLALTIDRYFSIAKPLAYSQNGPLVRRSWFVGIHASSMVAATRFHNFLDNTIACNSGYSGIGSSLSSPE